MTILDRILSIEHRQHGLSLGEDEDFVYLIFRGTTVATWHGMTVKVTDIHKEADKYLKQDAVLDAVKTGGISIGGKSGY